MRKEQARIFHARQLFPAFRPSCDKEGSPFGFSTSRASDTMRRGFRVCRYLGEEDRTSSLLWLLSLKGLRKARTEYSFNPELREGQNERQMFFDGIPRTYGLNPSQSLWRRITRSISVYGTAFPCSTGKTNEVKMRGSLPTPARYWSVCFGRQEKEGTLNLRASCARPTAAVTQPNAQK